jgi:hypothetical protein
VTICLTIMGHKNLPSGENYTGCDYM